MDRKLALFSLSKMEQGRIAEIRPDLKNLSGFQEIENLVHHSLTPAKLIQTQTPSGTPLKEPRNFERPFQDENLLQKLIQYKNQIPLSPRIIRATDS